MQVSEIGIKNLFPAIYTTVSSSLQFSDQVQFASMQTTAYVQDNCQLGLLHIETSYATAGDSSL